MNPVRLILEFLVTASLAGLFGAVAMTAVMRLIARSGWTRADMVVAVGSLLTRSRENALMVGVFMHGFSAVAFGMLYTLLLLAAGMTGWPEAMFAGGMLGVFHGLVVSLALCWVVADNHPLEEYRRAGFSVAVSHFFGHVVFGAVTGLAVALAPL